jgi:DNA polymerase
MSDLLSDDINDYCFIDTETKALPRVLNTVDEDVTKCGAYRYSENAVPIMVQWAVGDAPPTYAAFPDFDPTRQFIWDAMPPNLQEFHERALAGEAWYCAWNSLFDRLMLNRIPGCVVRPNMMIDIMAQGAASNLPARLEGASRAIHRHGKQQDGKALIQMFTTADWETYTPQSHPVEWQRFCTYGLQDIDELRAVFHATRKLPRREWEEFWVSEKINDRGKLIDVEFAERCAQIATVNRARLNALVGELTAGAITKVTQRERIANYLFDNCALAEPREMLVTRWVDDDEVTGEEDMLVADKLSIAEEPLTAYVNFFENRDEEIGLTDEEYDLLQLAEARLIGSSSTPAKFQKALDQRSEDDRLRGPYRFNGAQQTGRFSSQGVQEHNLIRASLTDKEHPTRELDVIEFINSLALEG